MTKPNKTRLKKRNRSIPKSKPLNKSIYIIAFLLVFSFIIILVSAGSPTIGSTSIISTNSATNDTNQNITWTTTGNSCGGESCLNITGQIWVLDNRTFNTPKQDYLILLYYPFQQENQTNQTTNPLDGGVVARDYTHNNISINTAYGQSKWKNGSQCSVFGRYDLSCWSFNGHNSENGLEADVGGNQNLRLANRSFTIEWLGKRDGNIIAGSNGFFFIKRHGSSPSTSYGAGIDQASYKAFFQFRLENETLMNVYSPFAVQNGTWWQYNYVYNKTSIEMWINGTLVNQTFVGNNGFQATDDFRIGMNINTNAVLNGSISQLIIYNMSLSQTQIRLNYADYQNNKTLNTLTSDHTLERRFYRTSLYVVNSSEYGIQVNTSYIGIKSNISANIDINYSNIIKTISFQYGLNEKDNIYEFLGMNVSQSNAPILEYYNRTNTNYVRVWLQYWTKPTALNITDTIPYQNTSTEIYYNFTNSDRLVNTVLSVGAIPYVSFTYAPRNLSKNNVAGTDPVNHTAFAEYVSYVIQNYSVRYNTSRWMFGIWNEPEAGVNGINIDNVTLLFNITYPYVKARNLDIKLGGVNSGDICDGELLPSNPGGADINVFYKFLSNLSLWGTDIDFISFQRYGGYNCRTSDFIGLNDPRGEMSLVKDNFYNTQSKNYQMARTYFPNVPIYLAEWNVMASSPTDPLIQQNFTRAFLGSALHWMLRSNLTGELFFEATSDTSTSGFGLWSKKLVDGFLAFPSYYTRKDFTTYNVNSSIIYNGTSSENGIEVLPIKHSNGRRFITVINTYDLISNEDISAVNVNLTFSSDSPQNTILTNKNTTTQYTVTNGQVTFLMSPYEVSFFELNSPPTTPIINSPVNNTYFNDNTPQFFINNSDDADSDPIYYTLMISTEFSFTNTSYYNGTILKLVNTTNGHNITSTLNDGRYYWRVLSSDLASNSSFTEIRNFTIDATNPNVTLNSPADNFSATEGNINFSYSVSELNDITRCTLNFGGKFVDNTSTVSKTTNNSIITNRALGTYTWNVQCQDITGNNGTSINRTITLTQNVGGGFGSGGGGALINNTISNQTTNQTISSGSIGEPLNVTSITIDDYTILFKTPEPWVIGNKYDLIIKFLRNNLSVNPDISPTFIINPSTNLISISDSEKTGIGGYKYIFNIDSQVEKGYYYLKVTLNKDNKDYELEKRILVTDKIKSSPNKNEFDKDYIIYATFVIIGMLFIYLIYKIWTKVK